MIFKACRFSRYFIPLLVLGLLVSSCSSDPPERPAVDVEEEPESYNKGSLWPGTSKKNMFFADNKARRVGDIVTVHVIEKTTALNKAATQDQYTNESNLSIDTGGSSATNMTLGGGTAFNGRGSTGRSDQFSATVSCLVIEVLANGNMRIEGQRRMQLNEEEQYILVKGLIRPDDITYNNTILSSQMADVDVAYTGEGGMDGGREPNWLSRSLRSVWPF